MIITISTVLIIRSQRAVQVLEEMDEDFKSQNKTQTGADSHEPNPQKDRLVTVLLVIVYPIVS